MRAPSLEASQRKLYQSLREELNVLSPPDSPEIKRYERSFRTSLPARPRSTTKEELLSAVRRAQVILVGDFHPFRQSQKGFLRLLSDSTREGETVVIGVECVERRRQPILDNFCLGLITIDELRDALDFDHSWPFPWQNYKEILEAGRRPGFRLLALNHYGGPKRPPTLSARDKAAAELVAEVATSEPRTKIFVLFGELHLSRSHLPREIRAKAKALKLVIVHQNETSLYWKAPHLPHGQRAEFLRLRQNEFCVLNAVPWVKLQSYLDWLEGNEEEEWGEGQDIAGSIHRYAEMLAETLSLNLRLPEHIDYFGPERLQGSPKPPRGLGREEAALFRHSIRFQRTGFLAVSDLFLLPSVSTNALSEAAALLLWRARSTQKSKSTASQGIRLIAQFLVGFLGSKILNPKRKCNEVKDILHFLRIRSGLSPSMKAKRRVFRRALVLLSNHLDLGKVSAQEKLPSPLEIEACRHAGYILGNRLFLALQKDSGLLTFVARLFTASTAREEWAERLLTEVSRHIETGRVRPMGKKEQF